MNSNNKRLQEIQQLKKDYGLEVLSAESKEEVEQYYLKIDELPEEENKISKKM